MAVTSAQVQELYVGLLGRAADKGGLDYWLGQLNAEGATLTLENVRANFVNEQAEYKATYGDLSREDLVKAIYQNLFERTPDAGEVSYWANGTVSADQMVIAFLNGASAADKQVVGNKTFVAETYTNTVGSSYNAAAAKAVVDNVNGTAASVSTAISSIANGTVGGLVPGVSLINAVTASTAAITAYEKSVATTNAAFDTKLADGTTAGKDGVVTFAEATAAASAANTARFDATNGVSEKATATLVSDAKIAADAAAAAKAVVVATTGGTAALATYEAALAAQKALVGTTAATATQTALQVATTKASTDAAAALSALDVALTAGTQSDYTKLTAANGGVAVTKANLEALLNSTASATKTAVLTELAKVTDYAPKAIETVAKKAAFVKAASDVDAADDAAVLGTAGYLTKLGDADAAAALVVKAQAADAAIDVAKVVTDKFTALNNADAVAKAALQTFVTANADKVSITDVAGINATTQATAKADVFYFGSKAVAGNDFAIGGTTNFAAGDSIVLGTGYTFNSGALNTGNANTLEFFLVKGSTGTQVVIETEAYGNSTTTVDTAGNVTASANATVINLVGVTVDHLSVANGVISYV